jgi:CheY-like chemotaxis protein
MPLRGISVLVVEDDRDHRDLARDMLTVLGARVTVATNGEEGVKRLIKDGCPDLVLCDLRMPVMDGFEFAREVRTHSPCRHVRLVALTAIRDPVAYTRTWSAGYDAHLEKPLTPEKLEDLAARLLSGHGIVGGPTYRVGHAVPLATQREDGKHR